MRTSSILKYILILSCLLFGSHYLYAQSNSDDTTTEVKTVDSASHQLAISFDVFQPVMNHLVSYREGYEFAIDYYHRNSIYFVAEGGWGSAHINYSDLKYNSNNCFFRLGFNKSLLPRTAPKDWDMIFIGLRYAMGFVNRSSGSYTIADSIWGNTSGDIPGKSFIGYWAEITAGMRVELLKNFFVGYNIRGKFLLNSKTFKDLAPAYIAGYGKGDKNSVFDFNFYATYTIRWKRRHL